MSGVYIIFNEWADDHGNEGSEVVGAKYFPTENDAWEALKVIALEYGVLIGGDETAIALEEHSPHLQYEEYYIQELTQG